MEPTQRSYAHHACASVLSIGAMALEQAALRPMVPVQIEKFQLFRIIFWVSLRESQEIMGSPACAPLLYMHTIHAQCSTCQSHGTYAG